MAAAAEALLGQHAGPDVEALLAVAEELQLLAALHLLAVVGEDEEGVGRHRVQAHVLCRQEGRTRSTWNLSARNGHVTWGPRWGWGLGLGGGRLTHVDSRLLVSWKQQKWVRQDGGEELDVGGDSPVTCLCFFTSAGKQEQSRVALTRPLLSSTNH